MACHRRAINFPSPSCRRLVFFFLRFFLILVVIVCVCVCTVEIDCRVTGLSFSLSYSHRGFFLSGFPVSPSSSWLTVFKCWKHALDISYLTFPDLFSTDSLSLNQVETTFVSRRFIWLEKSTLILQYQTLALTDDGWLGKTCNVIIIESIDR